MITGLQLPFRFDPQLLKSDVANIEAAEWTPHYNERDYGGEWYGVALRSASGDSRHLHAQQLGTYADTAVLRRSSYLRQVVSAFECPLKSVRLLRLGPGSIIREHSDPALGFEEGEVRIHVPIQTNSRVEFRLLGAPLLLEEGNCYYVNVSLPHRVSNRGSDHRIHLVIDADVNDWVRTLFRRGRPVASQPESPSGAGAFRRAVLNDPALQHRLHAAPEPQQFARLAVEAGRSLGYDFDEHDIEDGRGTLSSAAPATGWLPVAADFHSGRPLADWVYFGSRRLTEPFFDDSVRAALKNPFARAYRHKAPLGNPPGMKPSGFIFHMSRCGSTLISRTLAASAGAHVVSEAEPIDAALQTNSVEWVRSMVQAFGRRRTSELHYIVKLDAWHIHNLPLIREAFPDTPWIFVHRDPIEVLTSQLQSPGKLALPGAMDSRLLGLEASDVTALGREEWCARALAGFCRSALAHQGDPNGLFVEYSQLPGAIWGAVAAHFQIRLSNRDIDSMGQAVRVHAKHPSRAFEPDSEAKRSTAPAVVRDLAAAWIAPLHSELRKLSAHA